MSFKIRKGIENDMQSVLNLITELAVFEKEPEAVDITVADLIKDGFSKNPKFQIFVAEEEGVYLAIHPDDPPWSVFGLPRIVGKKKDLDYIFNKVPSNHNGLTFCSGSLGAHPDNNLVELIQSYADRIHFVHLRSTQRNTDGSFYEANHLEGNANLIQLIKEFKKIGEKRINNGLEPLPMAS